MRIYPELAPEEEEDYHNMPNQYNRSNLSSRSSSSRQGMPAVGDLIDAYNEHDNMWCEAEISKIDMDNRRVYVSYLYSDFGEWISDVTHQTAKLHSYTYKEGGELMCGQRVEALNDNQEWLEGQIIDVTETKAKVHYLNHHSKFDAWFMISDRKIRPYGTSFNIKSSKRKKSSQKTWSIPNTDCNEETKENISVRSNSNLNPSTSRERKIQHESLQYVQYCLALEAENLRVVSIIGDGNCLFRSISHQIYGDENYHNIVRQKCMDYMELETDFFSQFIEGGRELFPIYIAAKRRNACWGDDPEIQALCEIYHRPAEIWAYDRVVGAKKLRTFHENATSYNGPPIRLSYYGGGHYDSVIDSNFAANILHLTPGEWEDGVLNQNRQLRASRPSTTEATTAASTTATATANRDVNWANSDLDTCLMLSCQDEMLATNDTAMADIITTQEAMLTEIVNNSEQEYIDKAIVSSLTEVSQPDGTLDDDLQHALNLSKLSEEEAYELALKKSLGSTNPTDFVQNVDEDALLSQAIQASLQNQPYSFNPQPSLPISSEEELLNAAIQASLQQSHFPIETVPNAMDFSYEDEDEEMRRAIAESLRSL